MKTYRSETQRTAGPNSREVERGETLVVTRNGRPIFDLVPHQTRKGLRFEAIGRFKRKHRIKKIMSCISDDFDKPLPEDFCFDPCWSSGRGRPGLSALM